MGEVYFSIIVPVYKVEKYIKNCIESILEQTYRNFELILVDDGSPDEAGKICDKYSKQDDRVKVFHTQNKGVVHARQCGVENSSGDYLVFVDGDDWITQECLERYSQIIKKSQPDIVCCGHYVAMNEKVIERKLKYEYGFYSSDDIKKKLYPILMQSETAEYFAPSLWAKAFKSKLYRANQLVDKKVEIAEDGACVIPCVYKADSMYIMESCLYYYRKNVGSVTRGGKVYKWDNPILVRAHLKKNINLNEKGFQAQLNRKLVHDAFTVAVSQFYADISYWRICKEIKIQLRKHIYKEAIKNCQFKKGTLGFFMHFIVKHELCFIIYLYAKLKRVFIS